MKIELFNWAGEKKVRDALLILGHEHLEIVEGNVSELMQKFLDLGLNVMVLHARQNTGVNFTMALDIQPFGQR